MNVRQALGRGGFAAAACVACCAPPIIAALGVTAGLAATVGIFVGLAAAIAVVLVGAAWIAARTRRATPPPRLREPATGCGGRSADPTRRPVIAALHAVGTYRRLDQPSHDTAASPGNLSR